MPRTLTLLLPCSIPPDEVLRGLNAAALPATLANCVARAGEVRREDHDEYFLRSLPHERWLQRQAGRAPTANGSVSSAAWRLRGDLALASDAAAGMPMATAATTATSTATALLPPDMASTHGWNCLDLTHVYATHDQLLLALPWQLQVTPSESAALLDAARQVLGDMTVIAPLPQRWYVHAPDLAACETTSMLRATGRNVDGWMPAGAPARQWRRLQNEIQMIWHDHPVNAQRAQRGLPAINSLWLHGGGAPDGEPAAAGRWAACGGSAMHCPEVIGCALASGAVWQPAIAWSEMATAATMGSGASGHVLAVCDPLVEPCLSEDWGNWLAAFERIEHDWLAPALAALRGGTFGQLEIVGASESHWLQVKVARSDLWKFWRKRELLGTLRSALSPEAEA